MDFHDLVVRFFDFWCVFRGPPSPPADGPIPKKCLKTIDVYDLVVRFLISDIEQTYRYTDTGINLG